MARVHRVVGQRLRVLRAASWRKQDGVRVVREQARFRGGPAGACGERELRRRAGRSLATGAAPALARLPGRDDAPFITSDDLIRLDAACRPRWSSSAAGRSACEFAQALRAARRGGDAGLPARRAAGRGGARGRRDASATCWRATASSMVTVAADIRAGDGRDGRARVEWDGGSATAERIVLATGPRADGRTSSIPASAGLELERGGLRVDEQLRTTTPRHLGHRRRGRRPPPALPVHARGDPRGPAGRRERAATAPTHTVELRRHAARDLHRPGGRRRSASPSCRPVRAATTSCATARTVRQLGKARATGDEDGFVKVVLDRPTGKLLGGTIVAPHAGDMLAALTTPLHMREGRPRRAARDDVRAPDAVGGGEGGRARRVQEACAGLSLPRPPRASVGGGRRAPPAAPASTASAARPPRAASRCRRWPPRWGRPARGRPGGRRASRTSRRRSRATGRRRGCSPAASSPRAR